MGAMNIYYAQLTLFGEVIYQDVNCPDYWRGSGDYDVTEEVEVEGECMVAAESEERARELIEEYKFDPDDFNFKDVEIVKIELEDSDDSDSEEVYDVEIDKVPIGYEIPEPDYDHDRKDTRRD